MQKGVLRKRAPSPPSDYAKQLKEKQALKAEYHIKERQLKKYVKEVLARRGERDAEEFLLQKLEERLDNVMFRAGMANTRKKARQLVSHGHFLVNAKPTDVPSYSVRAADVISVRPSSLKKTLFQQTQLSLKKYQPPDWIQLDKEKMEATVKSIPTRQDIASPIQIPLIFEFYSR